MAVFSGECVVELLVSGVMCETRVCESASGSVCVWSEWGVHGAWSDWGEE